MSTAVEHRESMLDDVSDDYDKSVGSFIYDSIAPVAVELEKVDASIAFLQGKLVIENLSGDELAQRILERTGIPRKPATAATGFITATGNGTVTTGDLFETSNGVQFQATETIAIVGSGDVEIEAVIVGAAGDIPANQIKLMPVTIPGIVAVNNSQPTIDGFEAESDSDLLKRYYERVQTPPTSANAAAFKGWAKEVAGVGDAKTIPTWNGAGTVKVVIVDADKLPASAQLVTDTAAYIDSVKPLGAGAVTVVSATAKQINIAATAVLAAGFSLGQVQASFQALLTQQLQDLAFIDTFVSYAKMGTLLLNTPGVVDYSNFTLNAGIVNVSIGDEEIAVVGTIMLGV